LLYDKLQATEAAKTSLLASLWPKKAETTSDAADESGLYAAYPAAGALVGAAVSGEGNRIAGAAKGTGAGAGLALGNRLATSIFGTQNSSPASVAGRALGTAGGALAGYSLVDSALKAPKRKKKKKNKDKQLFMHPDVGGYLRSLPTPIGLDDQLMRVKAL